MADEKDNRPDQEPPPDANSIPEVEAEIVEDDSAAASAFDDDDAPAGDKAESSEKDAPNRTSTLTPGVILFIVFAVVALLIFAYWRTQTQNGAATSTPAAGEDEATAIEPSPIIEEPEAGPSGSPESEDDPAQSAPEVDESVPAITSPDAAALPAPDKIQNNAAASLKEELDEIEPPEELGDGVYLPPPPASAGNAEQQDFRKAAKDALRAPPPEDDNNAVVDFDPAPSEDEGRVESNAEEASLSIDDAIAEEAADSEADELLKAEQETTPLDGADKAKIANDVSDLKEAFLAETNRLAAALEQERTRSAALADELAALRRDLAAALEARDAQTSEALNSLNARLDKIQNDEPSPTAKQQMAGVLALGALERALDRGAAYEQELQAVAALAPDAPAIAVLAKTAATGAPTQARLKEDFGPAARKALAAAGQDRASGFFGNLSARAKSVISVRPADPRSGDSPRAIMSRAEAALEANDLALTVTTLKSLPEAAQREMAQWIAAAHTRAEADTALDDLNALLAASLPG